jgi:REP element-mobilizing transposase RayT
MKKFRNKYRTESNRLPGWDYRNSGAYFVTICTQNRDHFFGECQNGKMTLSTAGMIVQGCWYQIPYLIAHAHLGAFVVMPNHIHEILILDDMKNDGVADTFGGNIETFGDNVVETFESNVSTTSSTSSTPSMSSTPSTSSTPSMSSTSSTSSTPSTKSNGTNTDELKPHKNQFFQNISPKPGSVSRIIQQYKTVCTKHIRLVCPEINFKWQSRFYDHIIRDSQSFRNITNYILNNPKNWDKDKFQDN